MSGHEHPAATVNPVATELHAEFPLLWEQAQAFDFAERLGGCSDPELAEIDRAMRELWSARTQKQADEPRVAQALSAVRDDAWALLDRHIFDGRSRELLVGIIDRVTEIERAEADTFADEFEAKATRARIPLVRRWYARRAAEARKIARSEEDPGAR
jgi:hypothetical protein